MDLYCNMSFPFREHSHQTERLIKQITAVVRLILQGIYPLNNL